MPFGYVSYINCFNHNMTERDQRKVIRATIQRRGGVCVHEVIDKYEGMVGFNEAVRIAKSTGSALIFYQPLREFYRASTPAARESLRQISVVTCDMGAIWRGQKW